MLCYLQTRFFARTPKRMNENDNKLKAAEEEIKRLKAENTRLRESQSSDSQWSSYSRSTDAEATTYSEAMAKACCGMDYASIDARWPHGDPNGYNRFDRQ